MCDDVWQLASFRSNNRNRNREERRLSCQSRRAGEQEPSQLVAAAAAA